MAKDQYAIVLDAGSSGTRLHIYKWRSHASKADKHHLPKIETEKSWTKKVKPGLASFGDHPSSVGHDYLEELFDHAEKHIPHENHKNTPMFLLATAGMRLLPDVQRKQVLDQVCTYAQQHTKFQVPDCGLHVQTISGSTEGLYGWIAANYLLGGFNKPKENPHDHHTYGFLDMGGASAQIAFAPNSTEAEKHADDLVRLRLRAMDGTPLEYQVFVTTWLGFGVNEARRRYTEHLLEAAGSPDHKTEIPDPCLPADLEIAQKDGHILGDASVAHPSDPYLVGTGKFTECLSSTFPLLQKDAPCDNAPCLFQGSHVPLIDFNVNHFIGISEYWHTTHEIFEMGQSDAAYDFETYQKRVTDFCSRRWSDIAKDIEKHKYGKKVDERTAADVCFKASWLINVLHDGIGVPRVGLEAPKDGTDAADGTKDLIDSAKKHGYLAPFQPVNKIDSTEVSWTLGKMVLYASSQIAPATEDALPVGFGANVGGPVPADFQQPAIHVAQFDGSSTDASRPHVGTDTGVGHGSGSDTDDSDLEDNDSLTSVLSSSAFSRRGPGFIVFLLLIVIAALLLCGRDRRRNLWRKVTGKGSSPPALPVDENPRRRRKGLGSFFGGGGADKNGRYERVDDGLTSPQDFELGSLESDSDSGGSSTSTRRAGTARTRSVQALGSGMYSPRGALTPRGTMSPRLGRGGSALGLANAGASYFDARSPVGSSVNLADLGSRPASPRRSNGVKESVD